MEADQATITWSVRQATERLNLSRSTLYRLMGSGELVYVKVGTRRLIPESSLRSLIEANSIQEPE